MREPEQEVGVMDAEDLAPGRIRRSGVAGADRELRAVSKSAAAAVERQPLIDEAALTGTIPRQVVEPVRRVLNQWPPGSIRPAARQAAICSAICFRQGSGSTAQPTRRDPAALAAIRARSPRAARRRPPSGSARQRPIAPAGVRRRRRRRRAAKSRKLSAVMGPATTAKNGMARACQAANAKKAAHSRPGQRSSPPIGRRRRKRRPAGPAGKNASPATLRPWWDRSRAGRTARGTATDTGSLADRFGGVGKSEFGRQGKGPERGRVDQAGGDAGHSTRNSVRRSPGARTSAPLAAGASRSCSVSPSRNRATVVGPRKNQTSRLTQSKHSGGINQYARNGRRGVALSRAARLARQAEQPVRQAEEKERDADRLQERPGLSVSTARPTQTAGIHRCGRRTGRAQHHLGEGDDHQRLEDDQDRAAGRGTS